MIVCVMRGVDVGMQDYREKVFSETKFPIFTCFSLMSFATCFSLLSHSEKYFSIVNFQLSIVRSCAFALPSLCLRFRFALIDGASTDLQRLYNGITADSLLHETAPVIYTSFLTHQTFPRYFFAVLVFLFTFAFGNRKQAPLYERYAIFVRKAHQATQVLRQFLQALHLTNRLIKRRKLIPKRSYTKRKR